MMTEAKLQQLLQHQERLGDTSNVVLPIVIIAVAGAAVAVVYKKRKVGQN